MLFIAITVVHVTSCVLLIVAVLLQPGKDAGLSGAFGMGGGQSIFGARAGDVMTKATVVLAVLFMTTCLLFTRIRPGGGRSIVSIVPEEKKPASAAAPASPAEADKNIAPVAPKTEKK